MATQPGGGFLHRLYTNRIGTPTSDKEVRGYWVFITGLLIAVVGLVLFLPSESAQDATGLTLRGLSIFLVAVGLAMFVAGPVIRLPLQSWADYAAYLGQLVAFAAAAWFLLIFPEGWTAATGNQPVMILYTTGIAIIAFGGGLGPLLVGASDRSTDKLAQLRSERDALQVDRDRLAAERDAAEEDAKDATEKQAALETQLETIRTSQSRFELYEDNAGQHRWRLRHRNGNIIATGGQGYTRRHNAENGIAGVRRDAIGAEMIVIESEEALPDPESELTPFAEAESQGTFEAYADNRGEWRFRLRHDNGNIIADGGEGYASKSNVTRAIERIRELAGPAQYLTFAPAGFEVYSDAAGEYRWRLIHRNGNIIADSGEGYTRRHDATRAVRRLQDRLDAYSFEVYEDAADEHRWRLVAENGNIVADGGEGYPSQSAAENAVERVQEHIEAANVLDIGEAAFEVFEDNAGRYRWRLRHRNGNILLDSGDGYASRSGAYDGIESVKRTAPAADLDVAP